MEDQSLSALLSLYQVTCSEISKYESTKFNIPILASAFLGTVLSFVINDTSTFGWPKVIPLLGLVLISVIVYHIFSFSSRMSSILQGYAAYLEEEINQKIGQSHAKIYSQFIDSFIIPSKFLTNKLSFICLIPLLAVVDIGSIAAAFYYATDISQRLMIALCVLVSGSAIFAYILDCCKNDQKRAEAKTISSKQN